MSTATLGRPPMTAVYTTEDADEVGRQLEKRRFARFMVARHTVLHHAGKARAGAAELVRRLQLTGALLMARRTCGWLLGATGRAARTRGVLPGLAWALMTNPGQHVLSKTVGLARVALSTVAKAPERVLTWTLGLIGKPGAAVADRLGVAVTSVRSWVTGQLRPARQSSTWPRPDTTARKAIRALARERALSVLVGRFVPRPWSYAVRAVLNIALLPATVRRDAATLLLGSFGGRSVRTEASVTVHGTEPAGTSTAGAGAADGQGKHHAPSTHVVDLAGAAVVEPALVRYPAPKNSAKRRR